jgi:hypothetical protein
MQTGKVGKRQRYSAAQCLYRLAAPEIKGSAAVANDGTAQNAMTSGLLPLLFWLKRLEKLKRLVAEMSELHNTCQLHEVSSWCVAVP